VTAFSIQNPAFITYLITAAIMILKLMGQGWMTVYRMIKSDEGLLNPEDLKPGPANRHPRPEQLARSDYVDRSRRMHRNDLENIPAFLGCGLLFVAVSPPLIWVNILMYTFVATRLAHTIAYATGQRHEVRATFYTIGSLIVIGMAIYVLITLIP
jgi:glutathione S-transferase